MTQHYQFKNITEMLDVYYGNGHVIKADAPVLTTTTGVLNKIFGAQAFSQLNSEGNVFALLPKYPWQHSGFRVITAHAGSTADGGLSESGTVPATIKPTFAEISLSVKQVSHTFQASMIQQGLVRKTQDDAIGDMEFLRGYFATKHALAINQQLCIDIDTLASAGNTFESIDRVTGATALATAGLCTAADEDIYGIDRSGASWADAVVDHNSGTDRSLTLELIRTTLATLEANGARTNIMLTGSDTKWRIFGLCEAQVRYNGVLQKDVAVSIGVNGVKTEDGLNFGVRVATVYNIPLFVSQSVAKDTLSRIYLLDTTTQDETGVPRLGIALLYPTLYFEAGLNSSNRDPFSINFFGDKGGYYTAGELICTFFKAQGSIRDLK
jgi:hypothetical protein